jgi:hypothetical protein
VNVPPIVRSIAARELFLDKGFGSGDEIGGHLVSKRRGAL